MVITRVETFISGFHDEKKAKKMKYKPLGKTGMMVSRLGLGTSALGGVYGQVDEEECYQIIEDCLKAGINYIDTAPWYGNSEDVIGRGLRKKKIPRKAYYLATKVGRYEQDIRKMFDFSAERVTRSIDESLEKLGVEYIDLIQVHDMEFAPSLDIIVNETLPALQKAKDCGKVRHIGITGYPLENFRSVLERSTVDIDSILSYCHYSLNDTTLEDILPYFKSKEVGIINASPNSMGLLTNNGPPDWHPASEEVKTACRKASNYAQKESVNIARVALDFSCSHNDIHTTLVSASRKDFMEMNIEVVTSGLSQHEKKVSDEIRNRFFSNLKDKDWAEREVKQYWQDLNEATKTTCPA